ncbi:MAG: tRNA-intron lyase [Euryarchaeota archaeon]|nr:tRNA-intron lyase [Euryarchaeota archaeon]
MPGELRDDHVFIQDQREASQVHNRGWFGTPQTGGALRLEPVEALHLLETGRLEVLCGGAAVPFEQLLKRAVSDDPGFEIRYLVYSDLRRRGFTVKPFLPPPPDFAVYDRGALPSRASSKHHVLAISERTLFDLEELRRIAGRAASVGKGLMLALVDEEGDLTYYELSVLEPCGGPGPGALRSRGPGVVLEERVLVFDQSLAAALRAAHYGRPAGKAQQLSLLEAVHLEEEGSLELEAARTGQPVARAALLRKARRSQPDFDLRLRAYRDLRRRGLVVRTGFKYGTHFRLYDADPESAHARFLLHAVPRGYTSTWPEISRAVRLAHGVRKEMLLARVGQKDDITYLKLGRSRP